MHLDGSGVVGALDVYTSMVKCTWIPRQPAERRSCNARTARAGARADGSTSAHLLTATSCRN